MEWFRIIVDLFIGIAWPVALVVCLLIFKAPIKDLLSRRPFKIGKEGVEFGAVESQPDQSRKPQAPDDLVKPPEHPNPLIKPYLEQMEVLVKAQLDRTYFHKIHITR